MVTVAVIHSLSYTGTTWLNTVIGAHPRAFAIGPPDRVYSMRRDGWQNACLVHGECCGFWPAFHRVYDPKAPFLLQLAEFAGCDVIAINNPSAAFTERELRDVRLRVRPIHLVRDGRAIAASYLHHHPDATFLDAVLGFLKPSFDSFYFDPDDPDILCIRYEDVAAMPESWLPRVFAHLGLEDHPSAARFWEAKHHLTTANIGVVALLRYAEGLDISSFSGEPFYRAEFERLRREGRPLVDRRWEEELTTADRFIFDLLCGSRNAQFGYPRDAFTLTEIDDVRNALERAIAGGALARPQAEQILDAAGRAGLMLGGDGNPPASPGPRGLRGKAPVRALCGFRRFSRRLAAFGAAAWRSLRAVRWSGRR